MTTATSQAQNILKRLFSRPLAVLSVDIAIDSTESNPQLIAELLIFSSYIAQACESLAEQNWLQTRDELRFQNEFASFVQIAFSRELVAISFLFDGGLIPLSVKELRKLSQRARQVSSACIDNAKAMKSGDEFHQFAKKAFSLIQEFAFDEDEWREDRETKQFLYQTRIREIPGSWPEQRPFARESFLPPLVYRAFDRMDEAFGLDYEVDKSLALDLGSKERLYEGAGLGVQSSYISLLLALNKAKPPLNGHFIDLGSGYGRAGLVLGLLRPDMIFTGFEYVGERVEISKLSARRAGFSDRVQFFEQDLAAADFQIPSADVYYLFDPFTPETYRHVLGQLRELGRSKPMVLVSKGHASQWIKEALAGENWTVDPALDEGTLLIFRSPAQVA